jgi:hypothetical protein
LGRPGGLMGEARWREKKTAACYAPTPNDRGRGGALTQRRWGARELVATSLAWLAGLALLHGCARLPMAAEYLALALGAGLL